MRTVALVGFGTVGKAVAKILCQRNDGALRLTHICNRNVERKKQSWVPSEVSWCDNFQAILDSDVDIIVELIGGLHSGGRLGAKRFEGRQVSGHRQQATDRPSWTGVAATGQHERLPA